MDTTRSHDTYTKIMPASDSVNAKLRHAASNAGAKFYGAYARSRDHIDLAIDAASDGVERAEEFLIKQIKANPVSAAAAALGAGVFIGILISRR